MDLCFNATKHNLQDGAAATDIDFCRINAMTDHQVPLLLIYFNWCVIYAAARHRFALLSINKPHSKSQRALRETENKRSANGVVLLSRCSFMVDQLNVPPAER